MRRLWQERGMLKGVCSRHIQPSASQWWCLWVCPSWGRMTWYLLTLEWRLVMHTTVMCFLLKATVCSVWDLCRVFFIFQRCNASAAAYRACETINLLEWETSAFMLWDLWPSNSADLNQLEYVMWNAAASLPSSWRRWTEAALDRMVLSKVWVFVCRKNIKQELLCWIIVLRAAEFQEFWPFCSMQGVTSLKCGKKYDIDFVANFIENTTVTKLKIVNIYQSFEQTYIGPVFYSLCWCSCAWVQLTSYMYKPKTASILSCCFCRQNLLVCDKPSDRSGRRW